MQALAAINVAGFITLKASFQDENRAAIHGKAGRRYAYAIHSAMPSIRSIYVIRGRMIFVVICGLSLCLFVLMAYPCNFVTPIGTNSSF